MGETHDALTRGGDVDMTGVFMSSSHVTAEELHVTSQKGTVSPADRSLADGLRRHRVTDSTAITNKRFEAGWIDLQRRLYAAPRCA